MAPAAASNVRCGPRRVDEHLLEQGARTSARSSFRARFHSHARHPRLGHWLAVLAARGSDSRLVDCAWPAPQPAPRRPPDARAGLHGWSGVLLDPVGDSRHLRSMVRQSAARRGHRPGGPRIVRRRASRARGVAALGFGVGRDGHHRGPCDGPVPTRACGRGLESGRGRDARQDRHCAGALEVASRIIRSHRDHRRHCMGRCPRVHRRRVRGARCFRGARRRFGG